jgi:hypothetical protein
MSNLSQILTGIDALPPDELEVVYQHIAKRRQAGYWLVPGEQVRRIQEMMQPVHEQSAGMSDDDINSLLDEALDTK